MVSNSDKLISRSDSLTALLVGNAFATQKERKKMDVSLYFILFFFLLDVEMVELEQKARNITNS